MPRVAASVRIGAIVGAVFSAIAVVGFLLRLVSRPSELDTLAPALVGVIVLYFGCGAVGGGLVGLFLPARRWLFGRVLLGWLAVTPFYVMGYTVVGYLTKHRVVPPPLATLVIALLVGGLGGASTWNRKSVNQSHGSGKGTKPS
jgi:hypothetical protein